MYKNTRLIVGIAACLFFMGTSHATTWYVHPDSALNSIQAGIDSCSTGDTVLVGPGTYIENINFNGMAIMVTSEYGRDTTIIDGGNPANPDSASVVTFVSGEDTNSVLDGFTLTNGSGTYDPAWGDLGGGIFCDSSSPTITNNIITGCSTDVAGGIECEFNSNAIIVNNIIMDNTANDYGGGIECYYASPRIHSNTIDSNRADYGGGIACDHGCSSDITDNMIRWNTAYTIAGGIECNDCSPNIIGNIITRNTAGWYGGGIRCLEASPNIKHNVITDNIASYGYGGGGIRCQENSMPYIDSSVISNNMGDGIRCRTGATAEIHYCNITNNDGYGVYNENTTLWVDAENNWWGDSTGPYHSTTNPGGLGDTVSDYVDFVPWDTVPYPWGIEEYKPSQPVAIALQISPNPFRSRTDIRWQIRDDSPNIELKIYDATGRLVKDFRQLSVTGHQSSVKWDGTDQANRLLPSGVYFLNVSAGEFTETKKLLLIR